MLSTISLARLSFTGLIVLGFGTLLLGACGEPPVYSRVGLGGQATGSTGMGGADGGAQGGSGGTGGTGGHGNTGGLSGSTGGGGNTGGKIGATGGGPGQTGGAPGSGGSTGGNTGGSTTGGAGPGTGGVTATGGATGGAATGGASAGGSTTPAAIDCSAPSVPASGLFSDFGGTETSPGRWASSNGLKGMTFSYHGGTSSTAAAAVDTTTGKLHFTSTVVAGSYAGCGIVFDKCQSIGTNQNIRFSVSGTDTCKLELQVQTYNQRPTTDMLAGGCSTAGGNVCVNYCKASNLSVATSPVTVAISSLSNWTTALANQVVGVQWQLTNTGTTSCTADLTFDDIGLAP